MKQNIILVCAILTGTFLGLTGCNRAERVDNSTGWPTNATAREVKEEVREAVDATKAYAKSAKDDFVASMQPKLTQLDEKIDELGAKTDTLQEDAKAESAKALAALREKRTELDRKFHELRLSSKDAWQDVKAGFESAYAELEKSYEDAKAKFAR